MDGDRLFLIDHSKAFSTSPEIDWDEDQSRTIEPSLLVALQALDRDSLEKGLGDLISDDQIEAVLARRDQILDRVSTAASQTN